MTNNNTDQLPESPAAEEDPLDERDEPGDGASFPIVGVGASAGGLEAFTQLLKALPADTGMAFVLVQHLAPDARQRPGGDPVAGDDDAGHGGPGRADGRAEPRLRDPARPEHDHRPAGRCSSCRARAAGQHRPGRSVLPRAGGRPAAPGHRRGPVRHRHRRHPRAGSDQGGGRHHLRPGRHGPARGHAAQRHRLRLRGLRAAAGRDRPGDRPHRPTPVRGAGGRAPRRRTTSRTSPRSCNCSTTPPASISRHYKVNTLYRRITRRMVLQKMDGLTEYVRFLRQTPAEVDALYQDILISVTSFFRDPESFEALKSKVFPRLLKDRSRNDPVRLWTLGCSTGQEAYSLAIAFTEAAEAAGSSVPLQLFATDLNAAGIEKARAGVYPKDIAQDVSPERLRRFFTEVDGQLPDQQDDPRRLRLLPAQRAGRPALLAHRPDQLPQPAHLPGAGAAAEDRADPALRPQAGGLPVAGRLGDDRHLPEPVRGRRTPSTRSTPRNPGPARGTATSRCNTAAYRGPPFTPITAAAERRRRTCTGRRTASSRRSSPRPACWSPPTWTSCNTAGTPARTWRRPRARPA